jgi:hypothetical protein
MSQRFSEGVQTQNNCFGLIYRAKFYKYNAVMLQSRVKQTFLRISNIINIKKHKHFQLYLKIFIWSKILTTIFLVNYYFIGINEEQENNKHPSTIHSKKRRKIKFIVFIFVGFTYLVKKPDVTRKKQYNAPAIAFMYFSMKNTSKLMEIIIHPNNICFWLEIFQAIETENIFLFWFLYWTKKNHCLWQNLGQKLNCMYIFLIVFEGGQV